MALSLFVEYSLSKRAASYEFLENTTTWVPVIILSLAWSTYAQCWMNTTTPKCRWSPSHDHIRVGKTANTESDTKTPTVMIGELSRRLRLEKPQVMSTVGNKSNVQLTAGKGRCYCYSCNGCDVLNATSHAMWLYRKRWTNKQHTSASASSDERSTHTCSCHHACLFDQSSNHPKLPLPKQGTNLRPPWIVMGDKTQLWGKDTNTEHLHRDTEKSSK